MTNFFISRFIPLLYSLNYKSVFSFTEYMTTCRTSEFCNSRSHCLSASQHTSGITMPLIFAINGPKPHLIFVLQLSDVYVGEQPRFEQLFGKYCYQYIRMN